MVVVGIQQWPRDLRTRMVGSRFRLDLPKRELVNKIEPESDLSFQSRLSIEMGYGGLG